MAAGGAAAQALNAQGAWGGLAIPSAHSIGEGNIEFAMSDAREPQFGPRPRPRSYVLGFGLFPGLDMVGRFAEYTSRHPGFIGGTAFDGNSDLSANLKYSLALDRWGAQGLRLGVGAQDIGGGGRRFRTTYAVGTQTLGPWDLTLGYGAGRGESYVPGRRPALDGAFGGVSYSVQPAAGWGRLTGSVEYDGRQALAGGRWTSAPMEWLGGARFNAALWRTAIGAGRSPSATAWTVGLMMPFGDNERRLETEPSASGPVAGQSPPQVPAEVLASPPAAMARLKERLVALGLERVQVGGMPGPAWAITYQNRRFGHNEADALGVVLGEAARAAPASVRELVVVSLKSGQPVFTARTDASAWRRFLDDGNAGAVQASTRIERGDGLSGVDVDWVGAGPGRATWVQLQLSPEISYVIGSELADFDYSLAGQLLATVPLWKGAHLMAMARQRIVQSDNVELGGAFHDLQYENGLQALALYQSLWLHPYAVVGGAVGRFEYEALGAEGEAVLFVPGRDDVVRLRGRRLERKPDMPPGARLAKSASYRWVVNPSTSLEVGAQRFNDGSRGPTAVFTRWFSDVAVRLFYRKGGDRQYAGVEFSFPLTPRAAPVTPWVQVSGNPSYTRGLRTRLLDDSTSHNYVEPRRVRDLQVTWDLDVQVLNAGRIGPGYLLSQLPRMRQAYHLYASSP